MFRRAISFNYFALFILLAVFQVTSAQKLQRGDTVETEQATTDRDATFSKSDQTVGTEQIRVGDYHYLYG